MALWEGSTQQQQVYSTHCMNLATLLSPLSSSPPTPPLPLHEPLSPLTPTEAVEVLALPPAFLSHKSQRGPYHHHHYTTERGIHLSSHYEYPSPPSTRTASSNHSATATPTNINDTPYDLFDDFSLYPRTGFFGGHHVSGFPESGAMSTPSSMAVSTPSLSPSSPISLFNEQHQQSSSPPPSSGSSAATNRLGLSTGDDGDAGLLLSPLSPEWGSSALNTTTIESSIVPGILSLPGHHQNVEQQQLPQHPALFPPPPLPPPSSNLSPLSESREFDDLVFDNRRGRSLRSDRDLWGDSSDEEDGGGFGFPPFLPLFNLSTYSDSDFDSPSYDHHDDGNDLLSPSISSSSPSATSMFSRPILPFLDIPPARSGATTTTSRSRATSRSRSRSRSPLWKEYPPLPRSATPSVVYGGEEPDDGEDADVARVDDSPLDSARTEEDEDDEEDREFIVSPPSSGPPDTPSTPADSPVLPFLDLFRDDEEILPPPPPSKSHSYLHSQPRKVGRHEDVISIPGYFPHPTSPSIASIALPAPLPYHDRERNLRRFDPAPPPIPLPELSLSIPPPPPIPEHSYQGLRDDQIEPFSSTSPSTSLLSLPSPPPPPLATFLVSPNASPLVFPHASPRPALLQLDFEDDDFGEEELMKGAGVSPESNSLKLMWNDALRSPPGSTSSSSSRVSPRTRSPSPEFHSLNFGSEHDLDFEHVLSGLGYVDGVGGGVGGSEYAEDVKKLVELWRRMKEAEKDAKEREAAVLGALQAKRAVPSTISSSHSASESNSEDGKVAVRIAEQHGNEKEPAQPPPTETEIAMLQRAAAEARIAAKKERERAREVGMLLRLKLGEALEGRDYRMDVDNTEHMDMDMDGDGDTGAFRLPTPHSSTASPSPPSTPTSRTLATTHRSALHPYSYPTRKKSMSKLVAKMLLRRHEAGSSPPMTISVPPAVPITSPPALVAPSTTASSPSSASTSPSTLTATHSRTSSSSAIRSSRQRNPWMKGLPGSIILGGRGAARVGLGAGMGSNDRFLHTQLQQRYRFLRSSPLARSASDDGDDHHEGQGEDWELDVDDADGVGGGFEALRRPIMWGLEGDLEDGLLPAL